MALRKPLVINAGQIQQLQAGDNLDAPTSEVQTYTLTNDDSGAHAVGDVVYLDSADGVQKAKADASGTSKAVAVAAAAIPNGVSGQYAVAGVLTGLTGLTAGSTYYLSAATSGLLTATAPSTIGQYVVEIGIAISTTELKVGIKSPILL